MRILIFSLIFTFALFAKSSDSCYTIQLQSISSSDPNVKRFSNAIYPPECKLMQIKSVLTVRCGCYEDISILKTKLPRYKKNYRYAYIATSYKYRFKEANTSAQIRKKVTKDIYSSDEELKLMLQTFLYSNDLENAYKTALIGYKKHPNSYYWNQKMAEVTKWSGRGNESLKYMKFMYFKTRNPKLAEDIVDYALNNYQYESVKNIVTKEFKDNPSKRNMQRMVFVYTQTGEPEKAAQLLKKFSKTKENRTLYLDEALQIYMDMGDLDAAAEIVHTIEHKNLYTLKNVKLISYFYYTKRNIPASYEVLNKIDTKKYDKKLYELKSDLGWYLQDYKQAAASSKLLIAKNDARLVDYERVLYTTPPTNSKNASKTALEAYKKYGHSYLFYLFANKALANKEISTLQKVVNAADENGSALLEDSKYWFIKARLYHQQKRDGLSKAAIEHALILDPDNLQTKMTAISLYLQYTMFDALNKELTELSTDTNLPVGLYYPLASLFYSAHNINLSSYYADKLIQMNDSVTKTTDFQFLQADLQKAKNNEGGYIKIMREIVAKLKAEAKQNPKLLTSDAYLYPYLRAQLNLLSSDDFAQEFTNAKKYLTRRHRDDLNYAYATKIGSQEQAHKVYLATGHKEIWLEFANALDQQNRSVLQKLLFSYLNVISPGEASYAAENNGEIALAQSSAYKALNTNDDNQNAYIAMLNLTKKRSDATDIKISYYNRDPLLRKYATLTNSNYIANGFYLLSDVGYYLNNDLDNNILRTVPNDSFEFNLGVRKEFDKAELTLYSGYADSMDAYYLFSLFGKYQLTSQLNIGAGLYKNSKTDESTQLLLGGKKDKLELSAQYNFVNSTSLDLLYQHNIYSSQDDVNLGDGDYARASLGYQIRNGYPDMRLALFSDFAIYDESSGSRGVIDKLQSNAIQVLPNNFMNVGVDFAYGMQNSEIYTRVWRPYFEVSSYYNTDLAAFSYGFNAGIGGKLFSQDHLVIGTSYTNDVNGIGGSIFELFLNYKFLYTR